MKDDFYEQLQKIVDEVPRHDMLLVIGDWNAKVGEQQLGEEGIVGKFGMIGERSDNGERFVSFCALNNLAIASTMFPHKEIHRYKWTSPNGQYHNQIDHAAKCGQMKDVYDATRRLCNEPPKKIDMVRSNEGNLLTKEEAVQQRWKEYFVELLNRPNPESEAEVISDMEVIEEIP